MATIQVTASELNGKKEELASMNKQLKSQIEDLLNIANSLKSDWEGDASDAFQANCKQIAEKMLNATEGVNTYIQALGSIIQEYKRAESKNVSLAKG